MLHVLAKLENRPEAAGPLRASFAEVVKALAASRGAALQQLAAQLPAAEQESLRKYLQ